MRGELISNVSTDELYGGSVSVTLVPLSYAGGAKQ